MQGGDGDDMT
jgi:hypothetical protein